MHHRGGLPGNRPSPARRAPGRADPARREGAHADVPRVGHFLLQSMALRVDARERVRIGDLRPTSLSPPLNVRRYCIEEPRRARRWPKADLHPLLSCGSMGNTLNANVPSPTCSSRPGSRFCPTTLSTGRSPPASRRPRRRSLLAVPVGESSTGRRRGAQDVRPSEALNRSCSRRPVRARWRRTGDRCGCARAPTRAQIRAGPVDSALLKHALAERGARRTARARLRISSWRGFRSRRDGAALLHAACRTQIAYFTDFCGTRAGLRFDKNAALLLAAARGAARTGSSRP